MKDRIETLKGYLKRLGNGEPLETVRKDFVEVFKDVDPAEIMKAEQEMFACLLYTSDAADEEDSGDFGDRRIIKKKN